MTGNEQKQAAKKFAAFWKDKGYEKGQSRLFWISLLRDVFGLEHPEVAAMWKQLYGTFGVQLGTLSQQAKLASGGNAGSQFFRNTKTFCVLGGHPQSPGAARKWAGCAFGNLTIGGSSYPKPALLLFTSFKFCG